MSDANIIDARATATPLTATLLRSLAAPQLGALLVVATALTLGVGLIIWTMKPVFVPVAGQGGREDALQIIELLTASQVEYKLDASTGLVLVPQDQAAQVQMSMAANGLASRNSDMGMEILQEEPSLGTSHFAESARYQHALETELSRTISSMRNVDSARVHLAIPKQSVFIRDRAEASASIMIKAKPGRSIEEEQVNAVINLVASSIPYLESGQVTVVDQWGRLLSTGDDSTGGATRDQYQYARKLEKLYSERIESLLTPIVGPGRVRAIVTADVDFTMNEQTQESYEPDAQQLRSEQVDTQINRDGTGAEGIPGALTNQPPGNGTVDPQVADEANADGVGVMNESSSAVRNYELDRTITHMRQAPGSIQRISAAVIIDDRLEANEAGEPVRTPLTEEELAEYTRLAQEAVGFSEQRGDSVVVFNRAFKPVEEILPIEPLPIWQQSWLWTMVRQVLIGLSVLLLVLLVLRPAVRRLVPVVDKQAMAALEAQHAGGTALQHSGNSAEAAGKSSTTQALQPPDVIYGDILNMARAMAAEDPKRVAKVVKDWVAEQ